MGGGAMSDPASRQPTSMLTLSRDIGEESSRLRRERLVSVERGLRQVIAGHDVDSLQEMSDVVDKAQAVLEHSNAAALLSVLAESRAEIDRALAAIAEGRYGLCEDCGEGIPPERLAVVPEATRCVDCQRARDAA